MTTDSTDVPLIEQTQETISAWSRYWQSINWDNIFATVIEKGFSILFFSVLFFILYRLGKYLIHKLFTRYLKKQDNPKARAKTIRTLLDNIFVYTLFFFYIYTLLTIFGVPIGSLLAGAGIVGLTIGLGAQGFMSDIITGFFILIESQMNVGDYVKLLNINIEGTVIALGIRTTKLRSLDGTVHFIPNRNITTISNLSRSNMQAVIDIRIVPAEGLDEIKAIIKKVNEQLKIDLTEITDGPTIFGLVDLGNGNFAMRTSLYTINGRQAAVKEIFLQNYVAELTAAGFTIPNQAMPIA
ncbi:mechanosensitive ion channel family protein [Enterococcus timonensis]|uniref:mechanosensitive ion channel family protein n=1 Tax=Enterococcus timonensis TaxID=1852364 RepID=UPI000A5C8979|nr:mechanosensitive ion channel family protein [Enterococcus timonensis]